MSACSSADGSSVALRKHSSVRKSPTPWTGSALACTRARAVGHVGEQLDGDPVGRRGRTGPVGQRGRGPPCWRPPAPAASTGSPPTSTSPDSPSTTRNAPWSRSVTPAVPTTHGMPSCRAMIAVWLVAPPRSVTSATMSSGSSPDVSLGARSSATSTDGSDGVGTPGSGSPTRWATTRRSMSSRSVTRSAIRPPMLVKIVTNCSTAASTADTRPWPAGDVLGHRAAQALVAGQSGARGQHLRGRAGGLVGLAGEAVGDRADRVVVRRHGGLGVGEVAVAEARDRLGRDLATHEQGRSGGDSGHDRRPAEHGVSNCGHGHTVVQCVLDNQQIRG